MPRHGRRNNPAGVLAGSVFALLLAGCAVASGPVPEKTICVVGAASSARLHVEVAASAPARARGLMHRDSLDANRGMLFVFDDIRPAGERFWMVNTLIPLDIAFLDHRGVIVGLRQMAPCREQRPLDCPRYGPQVPYQYALETNRGFFARHGFQEGDRVVLEPEQDCGDPAPGD